MTSHLQVVPEEEDYADQYEWAPTGGKSHTFHIRPPIFLHNLLPYLVDITYEVSTLSLLWCMRWSTLSVLWSFLCTSLCVCVSVCMSDGTYVYVGVFYSYYVGLA